MLLTIYANGTIRDVVVAVQKSGFAWALNRDNGEIVWFKVSLQLIFHKKFPLESKILERNLPKTL